MVKIRVGVLLQPQLTTYDSYAQAVRQAEALGVDTVWNWDHLFPPYEKDHRGNHFEAWTLLAAMAELTNRAEIGCLVTCNSYRNPDLLANMAKTVDHISHGRLILGIGAGWLEKEYVEYGYPFGAARDRLQSLEEALVRIKARWQAELPPPVRNPIPILIGGEGERVTLRLVAEHANIWNGFGPPEMFKLKSQALDRWCAEVGRDPAQVERSVLIETDEEGSLDQFLAAGASHLILSLGEPWDFRQVERLINWRDEQNR